jgi:O-antigen/teichoic acid export membrane protein
VIENKLKLYSLIMLLSGVFSTIIVLILISATNLGMYAVAGTSSLIAIMRNLFFIVPFSAKYLNLKWNAFVPEAAYSLLCVSVLFFIGYIIKQIMRADTWLSLILVTLFTSVIGLVINVLIVLSKTEKKSLITGIRKRLRR